MIIWWVDDRERREKQKYENNLRIVSKVKISQWGRYLSFKTIELWFTKEAFAAVCVCARAVVAVHVSIGVTLGYLTLYWHTVNDQYTAPCLLL